MTVQSLEYSQKLLWNPTVLSWTYQKIQAFFRVPRLQSVTFGTYGWLLKNEVDSIWKVLTNHELKTKWLLQLWSIHSSHYEE